MKTIIICAVFFVFAHLSGLGPGPSRATDDAVLQNTLVVADARPVRKLDGRLLAEKALVAETLIRVSDKFELEPQLATRWRRTSPTTWEIELRTDAAFHDGSPVNAQTVSESLERILANDPRARSQSQIVEVEARGSTLVRVETAEPLLLLPEVLATSRFAILGAASYGPDGKDVIEPVGTGPFRFAGWDKGKNELTVSRNPDYWGPKAKLEKMVFRALPDANTRVLALEKGEIDFTFELPYAEVPRLRKLAGLDIKVYNQPRIYRLEMNLERPPFDDVRVRRALSHAIDREAIVSAVLHGAGEATRSPFLSSTPWHEPGPEAKKEYNPEKARELLAEAGWVEKGGIRQKDERPFEITIMTWSSRPGMPPMAEALQAQLAAVGISAQVRILETGAIRAFVKKGDWDMVLSTYSTAEPDRYLNALYRTGGRQNVGPYSNAEVDRLLDTAANTEKEDERHALYRRVQRIVGEELPIINISHYSIVVGMRDHVKGFRFDPGAHDLHTSAAMWKEK